MYFNNILFLQVLVKKSVKSKLFLMLMQTMQAWHLLNQAFFYSFGLNSDILLEAVSSISIFLGLATELYIRGFSE